MLETHRSEELLSAKADVEDRLRELKRATERLARLLDAEDEARYKEEPAARPPLDNFTVR